MSIKMFCAHCGEETFECMGSVKAGDFDEFNRGVRSPARVRQLCGKCATFYANLRGGWRWLIRFAWVRHPIPARRLHRCFHRWTGLSLVFSGLRLRQ